ncbi:histidinol-phosphate transaminase [Ktedonosporobacter rubrisoli]|uniref:Histidinol-phosphate aminotransferase n=1 Tax=Ktedonosporobacter rubrisoli TaxID=2509675 RepID=A0A4P6JQK5_KTERU|nr:histidinol-phosphate transaminase [Ktedonosporobacter rubrisoli]QBD77574.1 histidinol-phosphate transaminase [Ktedonosporobacter rubrisoli]
MLEKSPSVRILQAPNDEFHIPVRPEIARLAPYIPGESSQEFSKRTGFPLEALLKLNCNESPYGPVAAFQRQLQNYTFYQQYPDTQSYQLKTALAAYTGVHEHAIVLGHGSMELITLLWSLFLSPGDEIISCPPTFSLYATAAALCGAQLVSVRRRADYEIDTRAILASLNPSTKMIVVCSPNNPTGNLLAQEDLLTLLDTGRIVVVDEAYIEFSTRPAGYAHLVGRYENLVVLRSFSKWAGLAGLRIGYGLFPEWIASYLRRMQNPFEVNVLGHIAVIETLAHLEEAMEKVQRVIEERGRLYRMLAQQPFLDPIPSQGNFVLARILTEQVALPQIRKAVEADGILLRYFPNLLDGQDFLRVTVGLPEHTARLRSALAHVGLPSAECLTSNSLHWRFLEEFLCDLNSWAT